MNAYTIIFCANTSWYLYNFRRSTLKTFVEQGYDVVCVSGDSKHKSDLIAIGARFYVIPINKTSMNPFYDAVTIIRFFLLFKFIFKKSVIFNFTPKCNILSGFAGVISGIPVINNISGVGIGFRGGRLSVAIVRQLYKMISHRVEFTFFQNSNDLQFFVNKFGISIHRTQLIPGSGVDLDRFSFVQLGHSDVVTFGMFSRLIDSKGIRLFVDAAKEYRSNPHVRFVVAGPVEHGRGDAVTEEEISSWSLFGVEYLGSLNDVRAAIIDCDCIVLPSFYPEGTPKILLEAAAIGRPIITTNTPGCKDTVRSGNGILVEPNDLRSLLEGISEFLCLSHSERARMGKKSRELAEKFYDEKLVIEAYISKYSDLIQN